MNRSWIYVFIGGLIEVIWVSGLKHADSALAWIVAVLAMIASFYLIMKAASRLPVGTVYAVFTGLGTGGTVVGEMLLFGEPFQWSKTLLIALLLAGVVGLKLVTDRDAQEGSGA